MQDQTWRKESHKGEFDHNIQILKVTTSATDQGTLFDCNEFCSLKSVIVKA